MNTKPVIVGKQGPWDVNWRSVPKGSEGRTFVDVSQSSESGTTEIIEVRWRVDETGLWLETPKGVYGYDIWSDGEEESTYSLKGRLGGAAKEWSALSYLRPGEDTLVATAAGRKRGAKVKAEMPGKICQLKINEGDQVEEGQPVLVMEAMKMENEIVAPASGRVAQLKVIEGQSVESGELLLAIEPLGDESGE